MLGREKMPTEYVHESQGMLHRCAEQEGGGHEAEEREQAYRRGGSQARRSWQEVADAAAAAAAALPLRPLLRPLLLSLPLLPCQRAAGGAQHGWAATPATHPSPGLHCTPRSAQQAARSMAGL